MFCVWYIISTFQTPCNPIIPESRGPHRVTDVRQAGHPSFPEDVLHHGGQVVLSQLVDGEAPERRFVGVHPEVTPAVPVAPEVAEPHVVAGVRQDVAWGEEE